MQEQLPSVIRGSQSRVMSKRVSSPDEAHDCRDKERKQGSDPDF